MGNVSEKSGYDSYDESELSDEENIDNSSKEPIDEKVLLENYREIVVLEKSIERVLLEDYEEIARKETKRKKIVRRKIKRKKIVKRKTKRTSETSSQIVLFFETKPIDLL